MQIRYCLFGLTLTSVAALAPAYAAGLYGPAGGYREGPGYAVANWSGFYAGVNGGGAWSNYSDQLAYPFDSFGGVSPSGGFGGGQIGYNWQGVFDPHLVLGVEADIQGAGVSDRGSDGYGDLYKSELDYFGTVRGRIGFAFDRALVYATGGFAYGGVRNEAYFPGEADFLKNTAATGYTIGAGVEYKVTPAWSLKGEYQFIDLGKNEPIDFAYGNGAYSANGGTVREDAYQTFRLGVNYYFGPGF